MKKLLIMLSIGITAAAPATALSQEASLSETNAVARIAECMVEGPPNDWQSLMMLIELDQPGAETGRVRYLAKRASAPEQPVAYTPCDTGKPAKILLESRKMLAPERKGWTGARLTLHSDGKFELNYDFPKKD